MPARKPSFICRAVRRAWRRMSETLPKNSSWIVLIQKTARGPLSEAEIRSLLQQGLISVTDVAFRVDGVRKGNAEWKFLFQYPEFDRRKEKRPEPAKTAETPTPEKREPKPPPDATKLLPEDWLKISVQDWLIRTTVPVDKLKAPVSVVKSAPSPAPPLPNRPSAKAPSSWAFAVMSIALLIGGVVHLFWNTGKFPTSELRERLQPTAVAPSEPNESESDRRPRDYQPQRRPTQQRPTLPPKVETPEPAEAPSHPEPAVEEEVPGFPDEPHPVLEDPAEVEVEKAVKKGESEETPTE